MSKLTAGRATCYIFVVALISKRVSMIFGGDPLFLFGLVVVLPFAILSALTAVMFVIAILAALLR